MKNIIYLRTSTEEQNPENQEKDCLGLVKPEWGDVIIVKEMQSAFKDEGRPEFDNILKEIKAKRLSHLVVWDFDRLYRNRKKFIEFFQYCRQHGTHIHSFRQLWLESLNDLPEPWNEIMYDLFLQILGWIAEEESKRKGERVRNAIRRKDGLTFSYKGNVWGRKPLSTFKRNKIQAMRDGGQSMRTIAKELGISLGVVHKCLHDSTIGKDPSETDVHD